MIHELEIKEVLKDASKNTPFKFALYDIETRFNTLILNVNEKQSKNRWKMYLPISDNKTLLCANLGEKFNDYIRGSDYINDNFILAKKYFYEKQKEYYNKSKINDWEMGK